MTKTQKIIFGLVIVGFLGYIVYGFTHIPDNGLSTDWIALPDHRTIAGVTYIFDHVSMSADEDSVALIFTNQFVDSANIVWIPTCYSTTDTVWIFSSFEREPMNDSFRLYFTRFVVLEH